MNRLYMLIVFIIAYSSFNQEINAQFLSLQLNIEPELQTTIEQELDFGVIPSNAGQVDVALGDLNMGIFRIRAFRTQNIYLSLDHPNALIHDNESNDDEIPVELFMAYSYNNNEDYLSAIEIPDNQTYLPITENVSNRLISSSVDNWKELSLFLYGTLTVNNIAAGQYFAYATLIIDYD
ncbi:MAG: hypothetical protein BalsKO_08600 [Balneolaceae bacterium]